MSKPQSQPTTPEVAKKKSLAELMLTCIAIVYGDIGTSPLYTMEVIMKVFGPNFSLYDIYGVVSMIFAALIFFVALKYIAWVMSAHNVNQGGVLAALNLLQKKRGRAYIGAFTIIGIFATGLMIADGCITPAISVLSAMEGLTTVFPGFNRFFIIAATMLVLGGLFAIQSRGTDGIAKWFGPIMCVWFGTIGAIGLYQVMLHPAVLWALSPHYAVLLFVNHFWTASILMGIIGGVFLAMTGGEALYADMGHVGGRRPIAWSFPLFVLPALILNYLGQAAQIAQTHVIEKPFFEAVPGGEWAHFGMTILATVATVIASQALISGAFSIAYQAIQMGMLTRQRIVHNSHQEINQVYAPSTNMMLMICSMSLVWFFQTADNLAAAYGLAVSGTMLATTYLRFRVSIESFGQKFWPALVPALIFGSGDVIFLSSNLLKIPDGGWLPLVAGFGFGFIMLSCLYGNRSVRSELKRIARPVDEFLKDYEAMALPARPGVGIILTKVSNAVSAAVPNALKNGYQLFGTTVFVSVVVGEDATLPEGAPRYTHKFIDHKSGVKFHCIILRYGYMERLSVVRDAKRALRHAGEHKVNGDPLRHPRLFIPLERLRRRPRTTEGRISYWLKQPSWVVFCTMKKLAPDVTEWFNIEEPDHVTASYLPMEIDYAAPFSGSGPDPLEDEPHPIAVA